MMGDGAEEQNSESAVILRSASRTMRWMRISTRQSQRRNPDFRVRKGWVLSEPIYAPSPAREKIRPGRGFEPEISRLGERRNAMKTALHGSLSHIVRNAISFVFRGRSPCSWCFA